MSEEQLIRHCAPTLASIKTGNLFSCPFAARAQMNDDIRHLNARLMHKGLRVLPLRYCEGLGLIYVYRPEKLTRDLRDQTASALLRDCGYCCANPNRCIARLIERLREQDGFPHEIGLFLGYPPEDVYGFIHRPGEAKCGGCWKVYGDVEGAKRTFARFKKCSAVYWKLWREGKSIERLTVAV